MRWCARQFEFQWPDPAAVGGEAIAPGRVLIMGVVNVTPDSFFDGGQFLDPGRAVEHALQLVEEGADLLDLGGESTRPRAEPVPAEEELRRVLPVIEQLAGRVRIPLSIDTYKPDVARAALAAGASIVNDVGAARQSAEMWRVVAETRAGYVLMHSQGAPPTMQEQPRYENVVKEVGAFFRERLDALAAAGVNPVQVVLDVGLGFGKTRAHNLQLLRGLGRLRNGNRPLLLGASRKSFIGQSAGSAEVGERLPGSLACACWAAVAGVQLVRVHDVKPTRQALQMIQDVVAQET